VQCFIALSARWAGETRNGGTQQELWLEHGMSVMSRAEHRLTPEVARATSFRAARIGRRGLDEEQVRSFCHEVEAELARLHGERTALEEEVGRLRRRVLGQAGDEDGPGGPDTHVQAVGILLRAQQTADHYVAEAQEYSRHLALEARRRRDEILAEARSHAEVMEEAHREASEAARSAMAAADPGERRDLAAEVAYLRTFSEVYRTHLRENLDALGRTADERQNAGGPAPDLARRDA
jgi:cell division septum initiation protein DivIVA